MVIWRLSGCFWDDIKVVIRRLTQMTSFGRLWGVRFWHQFDNPKVVHLTTLFFEWLECVPRPCLGMPIMVLQSQDTCETDGKNPFCCHPKSCILSSHDNSSCSFSCNLESMPGPFNMRIGVHFRQDGRAHPGITPEFCYVNLVAWNICCYIADGGIYLLM